jgi:broad specificity phosphatase PhoE
VFFKKGYSLVKKLLIVRHAERPIIPPSEVGNEVMLTEQGKLDSRLFGQHLTQPVLSIKTSPIARCRQTAELIAAEVDIAHSDIEATTELGDPGFIIEDGLLAWVHWQDKGHEAVNQHLLTGSEKWLGFVDLELGVKSLCSQIKTLLIQSKLGTHVWVTHDTILATLASRTRGKPLSLSEWPEFLGYLEISLSITNELEFCYQEKPIYKKDAII